MCQWRRDRQAIARDPLATLHSLTTASLAFVFRLAPSINVSLGPKEDRVLTTGLHTVCDIYCTTCEENIGWFYEQAFEESQKYKEGPSSTSIAPSMIRRGVDGC
jgi:hypothetical protein